jgi:N-acetylated-alpha-linked acidic dipeptidase
LKQGWRPKRTIIYTVWDGEEALLLGSTEWVELHEAELRQHGAVYINSDGNGRGLFYAAGSHTLEKFINNVAKEIEDPEAEVSAWKRLQAWQIVHGSNEERSEARSRTDLRIGALGSGSDYSAFLQHAGVASLNLGFGGFDDDGIYHSIYDDFYHYSHFLDTDFRYGRALAQTVGLAVIEFADADILPYDFTDLADTVHTYLVELQNLLRQQQDTVRESNRRIEDGVYAAIADPRHPIVAPKLESVAPALNFAPLENATTELARAADSYRRALDVARPKLAGASPIVSAVNARLIQSERQLTDPDGLPRRPWYEHLLYAPGRETGYGAKTIPGVREAIEAKNYREAEAEIVRVAKAIDRETALINAATADLSRIGK